tara:strand:+ start:5903 stop:7324 length:1422 start_codon:yes stop_codon:yes gene_type:complete
MSRPLIKPSDARAWTQCARQAWLDNKGDFKEVSLPPFEQMVVDLGLQHEHAVLEELKTRYHVQKASSVEDTKRLMKQGVEVIYQAQLLDDRERISGYPDFLIKHECGDYQPADAKLSLSAEKKEIQVQLGLYRLLLGTSLPAIVFLGDGSREEIGDEANAIRQRFVTEMRALLSEDYEPLVRYSHSKCRACTYYEHCKPEFIAKEDLSLLYSVDGRAVSHLEAAGIDTISKMAASDPHDIPDVPYLSGEKKSRAVLQAKSWFDGKVYQTDSIVLPSGQWVHFDIEDNPLTGTGEKHVYLWGFLVPEYADSRFEYVWTDNEEQDRDGWLAFLDLISEYRRRFPALVLAHYSSHERTTINMYAKRYDMENHETVQYLLADDGPLFDLQKPILSALVLPLQAYGLKDICKHRELVNFQWEDDDSGSQWSVVQFHRFLQEGAPPAKDALKQAILGYNRDDVKATLYLERWLRDKYIG